MSRILITGSRGFFGSRLIHTYCNTHEILGTNSDNLDVTDKIKVTDVIRSFKPDYVIHAAAVTATDYCRKNPELCYKINVSGSINVAEACKSTGCRLIFLSTEQVFNGNHKTGPYTEKDTPCPDTIYGQNKLEAEKRIMEISENFLILRLTWLFGIPGRLHHSSGNILWDTICMIRRGHPFPVPVNEFRGLTNVDELIENFDEILQLPSGIYHTGSENPFNRYEIVCHIFRELGLEQRISELVLKDEEKYKNNCRDVRLDTSKIREAGISFSESTEAIHQCIKIVPGAISTNEQIL